MLDDLYDAVIGAEVAETLGYKLGTPIVVSHGLASFTDHKEQPFQVAGILERTGTPLDRTVIVSLQGIEAIHVDWKGGGGATGQPTPAEAIRQMDLQPQAITAALVRVTSRLEIFGLQRWINGYRSEPLMAILPGVALLELWQIVGIAEKALLAVSAMVVVTALIGMVAMTSATLNERRREMAILRAMGAPPRTILGLLVLEAAAIAAAGAALGLVLLYVGLAVARPAIEAAYGLWLPLTAPGLREITVFAAVVGAAGLACLLPAYRAYRMSLAEGMTLMS